MKRIPPSTWEAVRAAYVAGEGSTSDLAAKYGLALPTVQRHCAREGWLALRSRRARARLGELVPDLPSVAATPQAAPLVTAQIGVEWLLHRQVQHLMENAQIVDRLRAELRQRLESAGSMSLSDLEKVAAIAAQLGAWEAKWAGIRDRSRDAATPNPISKRVWIDPRTEPIPDNVEIIEDPESALNLVPPRRASAHPQPS